MIKKNKYIDYSEYIAEQIDTNIIYSEYIAEQLGNTIDYSSYLSDNLNSSIEYSQYLAETLMGKPKSKEELKREVRIKKLNQIFD